jgi:hypothetical protein
MFQGFYAPALGRHGGGVVPGRRWPLASRTPLPPPPVLTDHQPPDPQSQCWSKEAYDTALPAVPDHPDPLFIRGNFTMLVPGLENFPNPLTGKNGGFNDQDRRLLMTWELPVLTEAAQDHCLDYIASIHTHVLLSRPHGLNMGMTLDQLTVTCKKATARGLFKLLVAVSDGDSFDIAVPWFDYLLAQGALVPGEDASVFCWQVERYYAPPDLCKELMKQSAYCLRVGLFRWVHWLYGACAWWTPKDENDPNGSCELYGVCDRWSFQTWAVNYLNGHLGQLDHQTELDQLQSNDAKVLASLPPGLRLCCAEQSAQGLYDRPSDDMALYGRQKGRYIMATHYRDKVMDGGYLNDASRDDGSAL